jgi:ABC-2 type transport system permease protein
VLVINQDLPVALADGTRLAAGDDVVGQLRSLAYPGGSPLLRVTLIGDRAEAEQRLRDRAAAALIVIPPDFSAHLAAFQAGNTHARTQLVFVGDLANPTYAIAAVTAMTAADRYTQAFTAAPRPVELVEIPLGASAARTEFENYVPGLLVLAVVLMIFQAAMTPARDLESGTLRRLRLTPLTAFDYLGGISLWLSLVAIAAVALTFAIAVALGFRSQGPLWLALLVTVLTSLSIIGLGLLVACFSKTVAQAFVIANFPLGFLMFLTGAAFPLPRLTLFTLLGRGFALPDLLPPTHAVIALNKVFTLGAGLREVTFELAALTLLSAVYFGLGVVLFQKTQLGATR